MGLTRGPTVDPLGLGFAFNIRPESAPTFQALGVNNRAVYTRVVNGGTISKIRLQIGTSAGNISVRAYRNSGSGVASVPGTPLASSGSVACPPPGSADITLDATVVLRPGDWFGLSASDGTATFSSQASALAGAAVCAGSEGYQEAAHPLPAAPAVSAGIIGPILLMGIA